MILLTRINSLWSGGIFQVSALQVIVGSLLAGAICLIVGLVQLVPNAADVDHRYFYIGMGVVLLAVGLIMTAVRCFVMHCNRNSRIVMEDPQPNLDAVNSIDVIVQRRDTQVRRLVLAVLVEHAVDSSFLYQPKKLILLRLAINVCLSRNDMVKIAVASLAPKNFHRQFWSYFQESICFIEWKKKNLRGKRGV